MCVWFVCVAWGACAHAHAHTHPRSLFTFFCLCFLVFVYRWLVCAIGVCCVKMKTKFKLNFEIEKSKLKTLIQPSIEHIFFIFIPKRYNMAGPFLGPTPIVSNYYWKWIVLKSTKKTFFQFNLGETKCGWCVVSVWCQCVVCLSCVARVCRLVCVESVCVVCGFCVWRVCEIQIEI